MKDHRDRIYKEIELAEAKLFELYKVATTLYSSDSSSGNLKTDEDKKYTSNYDTPKNNEFISGKKKQTPKNYVRPSIVGEFIYYFENTALVWSEDAKKIFEYPEDYTRTTRDYYMSIIDEKTAARHSEMLKIFDGSSKKGVMSQTIITPSGKRKVLSLTSTPLMNEKDELIGVMGEVMDVTDVIYDKRGLTNFFNMSNDLLCIVHMDKYFLKVSPAWIDLLGYTEEELLSRSFIDFVHPDDIKETDKVVVETDEESTSVVFENRYLKKSGEVVYLSWKVRIDLKTNLGYGAARDVTESHKATSQLISNLSGKELLLREIHHRVKNNLQIITSLLSLQAGANADEERLTKLYEDSRNRIQSMAAIHELFYKSKELDKIEIQKYFDKLICDLARTSDIQIATVNLTLKNELVHVDLDTAIPLGLIVNEIVTNSIKHGKDEEGKVNIFMAIETLEDKRTQITIGDNGVNSINDVLNQEVESLGILLINSLVEQIDGEIEQIQDGVGTVFRLTFLNKTGFKLGK